MSTESWQWRQLSNNNTFSFLFSNCNTSENNELVRHKATNIYKIVLVCDGLEPESGPARSTPDRITLLFSLSPCWFSLLSSQRSGEWWWAASNISDQILFMIILFAKFYQILTARANFLISKLNNTDKCVKNDRSKTLKFLYKKRFSWLV